MPNCTTTQRTELGIDLVSYFGPSAELDVQSKSVYMLLKAIPISSDQGTELNVGVAPIQLSLWS